MIEMQDIVKQYTLGGETIYALDHVSLRVEKGEYVTIIGPFRQRQEHADEPDRLSGHGGQRQLICSTASPSSKYRERQLARKSAAGRSASFFRASTCCPS